MKNNLLISTTKTEIAETNFHIQDLQNNINNQILTPYEKDVAMQAIENYTTKQSSYMLKNNDLQVSIHNSNSDITNQYSNNLFNNLLLLTNDNAYIDKIENYKANIIGLQDIQQMKQDLSYNI